MKSTHLEIIRRGISTLLAVQDPNDRADLLQAAAELLPTDDELAVQCLATAGVLREAERCQLNFFNSIKPAN